MFVAVIINSLMISSRGSSLAWPDLVCLLFTVVRKHLSQVPGRAHSQDQGLAPGRGPPAGEGAGERREGRQTGAIGRQHRGDLRPDTTEEEEEQEEEWGGGVTVWGGDDRGADWTREETDRLTDWEPKGLAPPGVQQMKTWTCFVKLEIYINQWLIAGDIIVEAIPTSGN